MTHLKNPIANFVLKPPGSAEPEQSLSNPTHKVFSAKHKVRGAYAEPEQPYARSTLSKMEVARSLRRA